MNTENIFDEKSLRVDIAKTWGEHGAHIDIYDRLLKQLSDLKEPIKQEGMPTDEEIIENIIKSIPDFPYTPNPVYEDRILKFGLKCFKAGLQLSVPSEVKEGDEMERLYNWLMDENRIPAQTAFTAGWLRNLAKEIEFRLSKTAPIEKQKD